MDFMATQVIDELSENNFGRKEKEKRQIGVLEHSGLVYPLFTGKTTIGRDETCDIQIQSTTLSKHHATLETNGDMLFIEDAGSTNGTYIGNARLQAGKQYGVYDKTSISFGELVLAFRKHPEVADEETASNAASDTIIAENEAEGETGTHFGTDVDDEASGDERDTESEACTQFDDNDFISTTPEGNNQMTQCDDLAEVSYDSSVNTKEHNAVNKKEDKLSTLIRNEELLNMDTQASVTDNISSKTVAMLEMETQASLSNNLSSKTVNMLEMDTQASHTDNLSSKTVNLLEMDTQASHTDNLSSKTANMLEMETQASLSNNLSSKTVNMLEMDTQASHTDNLSSKTVNLLEMDTQASHTDNLSSKTANMLEMETQASLYNNLSSKTANMLEMDTQASHTDFPSTLLVKRVPPVIRNVLEMDTQASYTDPSNILEVDTQASTDNSTLATSGNILNMETQPSFIFSKSPIPTISGKKVTQQPTDEEIFNMDTQVTSSSLHLSKDSSESKVIVLKDGQLPINVFDLETQAEDTDNTSKFNKSILNADTQCFITPINTSSKNFKRPSVKPIKLFSPNTGILEEDTQISLLKNSTLKSNSSKSTDISYLDTSHQSTSIEDLETQEETVEPIESQSKTIWATDTQDDEAEILSNVHAHIPESQDFEENFVDQTPPPSQSTGKCQKFYTDSLTASDFETRLNVSLDKTTLASFKNNKEDSKITNQSYSSVDHLSISQVETQLAPTFSLETEPEKGTYQLTNLEDNTEDVSVSQMETQIAPRLCDLLQENVPVAKCNLNTTNIMSYTSKNICMSQVETQLAPTLSQLHSTSTPMQLEPEPCVSRETKPSRARCSVKVTNSILSSSSEKEANQVKQKGGKNVGDEKELMPEQMGKSKKKQNFSKKSPFSKKSDDIKKKDTSEQAHGLPNMLDFNDTSQSVFNRPQESLVKASKTSLIQQDQGRHLTDEQFVPEMGSNKSGSATVHSSVIDEGKRNVLARTRRRFRFEQEKEPGTSTSNAEATTSKDAESETSKNIYSKNDMAGTNKNTIDSTRKKQHSGNVKPTKEVHSKNKKCNPSAKMPAAEQNSSSRTTKDNIIEKSSVEITTTTPNKKASEDKITTTKKSTRSAGKEENKLPQSDARASDRKRKAPEASSSKEPSVPPQKRATLKMSGEVNHRSAKAKQISESTDTTKNTIKTMPTRAAKTNHQVIKIAIKPTAKSNSHTSTTSDNSDFDHGSISLTSVLKPPTPSFARKRSAPAAVEPSETKEPPRKSMRTKNETKSATDSTGKIKTVNNDVLSRTVASKTTSGEGNGPESIKDVTQARRTKSQENTKHISGMIPAVSAKGDKKSKAHEKIDSRQEKYISGTLPDPKQLKIAQKQKPSTSQTEAFKSASATVAVSKQTRKEKATASIEIHPHQPSPRTTRAKSVKSATPKERNTEESCSTDTERNCERTSSVFHGSASNTSSSSTPTSISSYPSSSVDSKSTVFTTTPGFENLSQSSKRSSQMKQKTLVMFSGCTMEEHDVLAKDVKQLGGKVIDVITNQDCVLIVKDLKRTIKTMNMLARGLPIVSQKWLKDSMKAGQFLDPWLYLISDKSHERKYGFTLKASLEKRRNSAPVLQGMTLAATPNINPPPEQLKSVLENAGASYQQLRPTMWPKPSIVVTCEEDRDMWPSLRGKRSGRHHKPLMVKVEAIWKSIQQQVLALDEHSYKI